MNLIRNGIKYLFTEKWYIVVLFMFINMLSYLFRFQIYRSLTEFISGASDGQQDGINISLAGYFIGLFLVHGLYNISYYFLETAVIQRVRKIFSDIVRRMMTYRVDFFKKNTSNKISQVWFYLSSVEMLIEKIILEFPRIVIYLGYYLWTIYSFSSLAVMIIVPINLLILFVFHPLSKKQYMIQQERMDLDLETKNKLLEATSNIEAVKLANMQENETKKVMNYYDQYVMNKIIDKKITSSLSTVSEIFSDFLTLIIYSIGISYLFTGAMKPIELLYLAVHTSNFYYQMLQLKEIYNFYKRVHPKIQIIYDILNYSDIEYIDAKNEGEYNVLENNKDIIFHNVSFGYDSDRLIFKDINFVFKHNKVNLLLGPNGSGKSTIVKLLLRLYELENKKTKNIIYFHGQNIKTMSLRELRDRITVVFQEPAIFNETVWENIIFGNDRVSDAHIKKSCEILDSNEWLHQNREKQCGFRGRNLSGGEKKKIQLVNAICKSSEVIIFDEPSNALDSHAIKWFIDFVSKLKCVYGKTVVIITHDLRLTDVADHIVDLNKNLH
jgi:ABC-type bacteriocin/lantibiotic exporter with double-glycine peptidase domain